MNLLSKKVKHTESNGQLVRIKHVGNVYMYAERFQKMVISNGRKIPRIYYQYDVFIATNGEYPSYEDFNNGKKNCNKHFSKKQFADKYFKQLTNI